MAADRSLDEQDEVAAQARRLYAFVRLQSLVARWRAEIELQDKADRLFARFLAGFLIVLGLVVAPFVAWLIA